MRQGKQSQSEQRVTTIPSIGRRKYLTATGTSVAALSAGCLGGGSDAIEISMLSDRNSPAEQEALESAFDEWAETIDANVTRSFQYAAFDEALEELISLISTGNDPDLVYMGWDGIGLLAAGGAFKDVSWYMEDHMENIHPQFIENTNYRDEVTVIPGQTDINVQWYRQDIYDQAGIEPATTYEEHISNMEALEDVVPDGMAPINVPANPDSSSTYQMAMTYETSNDAYIMRRESLDEPPEVIADEEPYRDRLIETYSHLTELYQNYSPDTIDQSWGDIIQIYVTENAAKTIYPGRLLSQVNQDNPDILEHTSFAEYPQASGDASYNGISFLAGFGVPERTQDEELVLDFVDYFFDSDAYIDFLHSVPLNAIPTNLDLLDDDRYLDNEVVQAQEEYVEYAKEIFDEGTQYHYPDYTALPENGEAITPYMRNLVDGNNRMPRMVGSALQERVSVEEAIDTAADELRDAIPQFEQQVEELQQQFG